MTRRRGPVRVWGRVAIEATFPGVCVLCGKRYGVGSLLVRWAGSWGHAVCVAVAENRRRIEAGETFAGTPATYHRKVRHG